MFENKTDSFILYYRDKEVSLRDLNKLIYNKRAITTWALYDFALYGSMFEHKVIGKTLVALTISLALSLHFSSFSPLLSSVPPLGPSMVSPVIIVAMRVMLIVRWAVRGRRWAVLYVESTDGPRSMYESDIDSTRVKVHSIPDIHQTAYLVGLAWLHSTLDASWDEEPGPRACSHDHRQDASPELFTTIQAPRDSQVFNKPHPVRFGHIVCVQNIGGIHKRKPSIKMLSITGDLHRSERSRLLVKSWWAGKTFWWWVKWVAPWPRVTK